ncbi:ArnT family glycosyltransferase [Fulvivirga sedimenti]|uniref:Glycosyltransferase RgtA/B/C/D-like domain-containing protein n=1 Tax=Fulvivirga sedimenti TaxID=2879465 RepID=A0A9X1L1U1_9BACT|nr:hypothetical protein [Fulvivirga sedimenti]MCA6078587.1 hypothetical protein [Fulvivirga sedimenti]
MQLTSHKFFLPFLLILFFLGSYYYTFDPKIAQLGDNASYYMLGKALSQGEGYVNISKINKTPNNHYPPGYPAILGVVMLFSSDIITLKLLNGLFLLGSVLVLFALVNRLSSSHLLAFITASAMLGNFHIQQYSSLLMSEVPFMFFSLLCLLFISRSGSTDSLRDKNFWFAIALAVVSYYIRSLGIALIAGAVFYYLMEKHWRKAGATALASFAGVLPWFLRSQHLGGGSYARQLQLINPYRPELGTADFGDYLTRITENFSRYVSVEIPYSIFPGTRPDYTASGDTGSWILGIAIIAITVYGIILLPKFRWLILGYLLSTFGILMLWPDVWVGVRFMIPVIPLILTGLFFGLYTIFSRFFRQANKNFHPAWLVIPLLFMVAPLGELHDQARLPLHPAWQNYYAMAEWLRKNEKPDVVVSCGKPALFYLYSGTYTMRYAFEDEPDKLIRDLEEQQVDYVVLDQVYGNTMRYLLPAIKQYPERFEQIVYAKNPDTFLLKFRRLN